uniref:Uncharacterized protein n=1 Tax=Cyprinus carpio TaxID=7962 RepID=A0A8C1V7Q6_CYPCA
MCLLSLSFCVQMLTMEGQVDVVCCKSVGTDLSMLDIEDFITEICRLKKEVASLEAKLRERGDKLNREDVEEVRVTDWTEAQDHESSDKTSDCNTGEQQMLQTPLKMCSVKLVDCRNLIESRGEETTAEEEQSHNNKEEQDDYWIDDDKDNGNDDENDGDDGTEAQDSVWSVRDQRSRDTQDSDLSLTLLCYTDAQDHESTDQTSDCNAGEQQMLQTPLKMCSVKLVDCRNLIESRGEETTAEKEQQHTDEEEQDDEDEDNDDDDEDQSDDDRNKDDEDQSDDDRNKDDKDRNKDDKDRNKDDEDRNKNEDQNEEDEGQNKDDEDQSKNDEDQSDDDNQNKDDEDQNDDDDFVPSGMFLPFMARCAELKANVMIDE